MKNRVNKRKALILFVIVIAVVLTTGAYASFFGADGSAQNVEKGVVYIGQDNEDVLLLDGQWTFAWNELLTADEMENVQTFVQIPFTWNNTDGTSLPIETFGAATYATKITGAAVGEIYMLRIPALHMAARYLIDNQVIYTMGDVAQTKAEYTPAARVKYVAFTAPAEEFMLTVQMSNFDHIRGGMWASLKIAKGDEMRDMQFARTGFEYAVVFILAIVFLSVLIAVLLNKGLRGGASFLGVLTVVFLLHITSGDKLMLQWLPNISVYLFQRLLYIVLFMMPVILLWQLHLLCGDNSIGKPGRTLIKILAGVCAIATLVTIIAPMHIYTSLATFGYMISATHILLAFVLMFRVMATSPKRKNVYCYFGACVAMGVTAIGDFLSRLEIIHTDTALMTFGFLITVLLLGISLVLQLVDEKQKAFAYKHAYLMAQIKPHFIFNALNTVIGTMRDDVEKSEKLAHAFATYLRSAIENDTLADAVPLDTEIETVKAYLEIELARYEDINMHIDVDGLPSIALPSFTLQPLVENAIKHGLVPKRAGGTIMISGNEQEDGIVLSVSDDGVGMSEPQLNSIRDSLKRHAKLESRIGLFNVNERFYNVYKANIQIDSTQGKGTRIELLVPKK